MVTELHHSDDGRLGNVQSDQHANERPAMNLMGERVGLGPLRRDLLSTYERWFNDFSILTMLDRAFRPSTDEHIAGWFERRTGPARDKSSIVFTIWAHDGWKPIGNTALQGIDPRNRTAEFGIFIGEPAFRGQGYGTEATRLMLDFAFKALGLHSIMLRVYEYNQRARRTYERIGFREFGRRRECQLMDGRLWDVIYMECLSTEFTSNPPASIFTVVPPVERIK